MLVVAALTTGCGSSATASTFDRYLFTQTCAPCHSLDSGAASPDPLAPNLATHAYPQRVIADAVTDGARGMPPKLLTGSWLAITAHYVQEHEFR